LIVLSEVAGVRGTGIVICVVAGDTVVSIVRLAFPEANFVSMVAVLVGNADTITTKPHGSVGPPGLTVTTTPPVLPAYEVVGASSKIEPAKSELTISAVVV
jgi:hypothetical protein